MSFILNYIKPKLSKTLNGKSCKMVLVVRADIPMGKGKTAAQCAHAALECYRKILNDASLESISRSWIQAGQPKIVVKIQSEEELIALARNAKSAGLVTAVIRDAGKTQLRPGTISVLGIGPGPQADIDTLTSGLKLL